MAAKPRSRNKLVSIVGGLFVLALALAWTAPIQHDPATRRAPLPTRWMAGDGSPKPLHPAPVYAGPLRMSEAVVRGATAAAPLAGADGGATRIAVIVEDSLYPSIQTRLQRLVGDLQAEGWTVLANRFGSGTAQQLRTYLRTRYKETKQGGLAGALFVGDIPYIVYELMQAWDGTNYEYEDFPCDIFYMDVDGTWSDSKTNGSVQPGNGKYDTRSGDIGLEIWVGRLLTTNVSCLGSESAVLNNYFAKDHLFRTGRLQAVPAALAYDDDDWSGMGTGDKANLKKIFSNAAEISGEEATTASDYKNRRMPANLEFIYTRSHGWPGGHGYYRSSRADFESVFCGDYQTIDPKALFYSFFVCSGCDFTAADYLGGVAAFNKESGLLAYGSTKTGGIWADDKFFDTLAAGGSFGAAFVDWFNGVQKAYPTYAPPWWYGMVLIGDASLRPTVWISGTVMTSAGAPLPGVTIAFGNKGGKAVTDNAGFFRHPVRRGWSGTATPKKAGYSFTPASRTYESVLADKAGQDYEAVD